MALKYVFPINSQLSFIIVRVCVCVFAFNLFQLLFCPFFFLILIYFIYPHGVQDDVYNVYTVSVQVYIIFGERF